MFRIFGHLVFEFVSNFDIRISNLQFLYHTNKQLIRILQGID